MERNVGMDPELRDSEPRERAAKPRGRRSLFFFFFCRSTLFLSHTRPRDSRHDRFHPWDILGEELISCSCFLLFPTPLLRVCFFLLG